MEYGARGLCHLESLHQLVFPEGEDGLEDLSVLVCQVPG